MAGGGTTSDVQMQPDLARLVGPVAVGSLPYGLGDSTGYQTAVTFTVENPSDFPMISPYRVSVTGGGRTLDTTTGSDLVVLAPRQRLLVVNQPNEVRDVAPDAAAVTFYANQAGQMALPDPAGWKLTNVTEPSCDTGFVGCEVNADLSYEGGTNIDVLLEFEKVSIAFTRDGRTVLAGNLTPAGSSGGLVPGQPVPVTGYVTGDTGRATGLDHEFGVQVRVPAN